MESGATNWMCVEMCERGGARESEMTRGMGRKKCCCLEGPNRKSTTTNVKVLHGI